jgi:hypothetical protein
LYSLWSRGRLLGHTDLAYVRWMERLRSGDLYPTEIGEALLPIVTAVSPAFIELSRATRDMADTDDSEEAIRARCHAVRLTTEHADASAESDRREAMELELRSPDGSVIPTEDIDVRDTAFMLALAEESMDDFDLEDIDPIFATDEQKELLEMMAHDEAMFEQDFADWDDDTSMPYVPDDEIIYPRYQIHVRLLDDAAIP